MNRRAVISALSLAPLAGASTSAEPSWVGTDQERKYEFSGRDQLILLNVASEAAYRLVWQRE